MEGTPRPLTDNASNRFAKEEIERRRKSKVLITREEVDEALKLRSHVYIADPRIGSVQKSFRFWVSHGGLEEAGMRENRTLGHRHTVEAVIYFKQGRGYSVIDGVRFDWEAGDLLCVPVFAWHRHHTESDEPRVHYAATTGPLSMYMGTAVYEDDRYPELWVHADGGEGAKRTLIPGGSEEPAGQRILLDQARYRPDERAAEGRPTPAQLYFQQLQYAHEEEARRRAAPVLAKGTELEFGATPMGRIAYAVDARIGFHVKLLSTLFAEIPPGKRSGAHRHLYEETDHVLSGKGYVVVDDRTYAFKEGDTLIIPVFTWHQYFNEGDEPARFLVHTNRTAMENMGYLYTQQGEEANYS
jgi:quercetin dioxygenase-like cupin family protein